MQIHAAAGTTPPGTSGEQQAAQWVGRMFAGIAPKYDFANHLLSFNVDRRWRKALIKQLEPVLQRPNARILDLCCGTGDVLLDLQSVSPVPVLGADFCHPMLVSAQRKAIARGFHAPLFEGDALQLPLRDNALDAIAISFGFRNLANYQAGLAELHRVLKPGGVLATTRVLASTRMDGENGLWLLFTLSVAGHWNAHFRFARSVCLSAGFDSQVSRARRSYAA